MTGDDVKLIKYDAACRAIAEARRVDEVKRIRDVSIAMKAYARQANNREMEANAVEIRLRATRRMDQMRQGQKATIGLAKGGDLGGRRSKAGVRKTPANAPATLAEAGIDKNLAKEGRKLGALSDEQFEQTVAEARAAVVRAIRTVVETIPQPVRARTASVDANNVSLAQWKSFSEAERRYHLNPENFRSTEAHFNKQGTAGIEWAQWSWNPVTGCLHDCPYCYARDFAERYRNVFPHGFEPAFRPYMLNAPHNTKVPEEAVTDARFKNVFACSEADLFGRWVPREWIEAVLQQVRDNPQWSFLFLTKFPKRMTEFDIPSNAWIGTTVDLQARVANAEAAFARLREKGYRGIAWLSVEPMLEPLNFARLGLFNWVVIGGASASSRTPKFHPPLTWIVDLWTSAKAADCAVYMKTNLLGNRILELPFDAPIKTDAMKAPSLFHYLGKDRE
jgi:protein gp37